MVYDVPQGVVPAMAAKKARGLPPLVRRGATQALAARWWGLLAVAAQQLVVRAVLRDAGASRPSWRTRRASRQRVLSGWMGPGRRSPPAASRALGEHRGSPMGAQGQYACSRMSCARLGTRNLWRCVP